MYNLVKDALGFSSNPARASGPTLVRDRKGSLRPRRGRLWRTILLICILLLIGLSWLAWQWPFTLAKITAELEDSLGGTVEIGKFHQTFFPPGCIAEDIIVKHYGGLPNPLPITARKLTIEGSFSGLLSNHVPLLRAEGVHVIGESAKYFSQWSHAAKSEVVIERYLFKSATIEFSSSGSTPVKFEIAEFSLRNPGAQQAMAFEAMLRNPKPPGELRLGGSVGPWHTGHAQETAISGNYSFQRADLGVFRGIAGTLSSEGTFDGSLRQLHVRGKTETPDFQVTSAGHKIALHTVFQARVDTSNGDITLENVVGRLGRSGIATRGSISGTPNRKGKTTSLDLTVGSGTIQDFLFLFTTDRVPPMNGTFTFRGHARLPSGSEPFLERLLLEGDFGVAEAVLSNAKTQSNLEELSERAEGEMGDVPERVVSDLNGHGVLRNGIASFDNLVFHVPGAKARLRGNYSLITLRIDLHGRLMTKTTLDKETSGIKSFLLKIISPVLKKNHRGGAVLALSVRGVYPHPVYDTAPITHPD